MRCYLFFACRIVVYTPHATVVGAALLYCQYYLGFNIEQPVTPVGQNGNEIWLIYYPCYWYNNLHFRQVIGIMRPFFCV